jgi:hypothetical protein
MNFMCGFLLFRPPGRRWQLSRDGLIQNHGAAFLANQDRRRLADGHQRSTRWSIRGCVSMGSSGLRVADVSIMPQVPGDGCAPRRDPFLQTGPKFHGEGRDFSLLSIVAPAY